MSFMRYLIVNLLLVVPCCALSYGQATPGPVAAPGRLRGAGQTPPASGGNIEQSGTDAAAMPTPGEYYPFGRIQAKKMLDDRILMAAFPAGGKGLHLVTESDAIFIWIANQFTSRPDCMIFWNPDPPTSASADHSPPSKTSIGFIRVASVYMDGPYRGNYVPFEQLWFEATFECNSIHMIEKWDELYQLASNRAINRKDFTLAAARLEFEAMTRTRNFYYTVWLPWAKKVGFESDRRFWRIDSLESFDKWIAAYSGNAYPEIPYGDYYDVLSGKKPPGGYGKDLAAPQPMPSPSPSPNL